MPCPSTYVTKMNLSGPNVIHFGRKSQFGPDQFILVLLADIIKEQEISDRLDQH